MLDRVLWPADIVAWDFPAVVAAGVRAADFAQGRDWPAHQDRLTRDAARIYTEDGQYVGLAQRTDASRWQPLRGLPRADLAPSA
jgi:hypothetical protein